MGSLLFIVVCLVVIVGLFKVRPVVGIGCLSFFVLLGLPALLLAACL